MKKDSNMFNDNNIETEGVPADKTAEIPKVEDSTEEENAKKPLMLFGARVLPQAGLRGWCRNPLCGASHRRRWICHHTCGLDGQSEHPCGVPVKGR